MKLLITTRADEGIKNWTDITHPIIKKYAESKGRNAVHGSDSDENAHIESNFHFSENEII